MRGGGVTGRDRLPDGPGRFSPDEERRRLAELAVLRADPERRAEYVARRNEFVMSCLGIVAWVIRTKRPSDFRARRLADTFQAGLVGLVGAVDDAPAVFTEAFQCYAFSRVWREIIDWYRDERLIRLPERPAKRHGAERLRALALGRGGCGELLTWLVAGTGPDGPEAAEAGRRLARAERLAAGFEAERVAAARAAAVAKFEAQAARQSAYRQDRDKRKRMSA